MNNSKLAAGAAGALLIALAASAAFAGEGGYMCQTRSPAKNAPPATHCITWTRQGAARLQAASCDPAKMAYGAMRDTCADFMAHPEPSAPPTAG
jgi:hypothetical protein